MFIYDISKVPANKYGHKVEDSFYTDLYIHAYNLNAYIKMKFNDRDLDIDMKCMMRQSNARCQERRKK